MKENKWIDTITRYGSQSFVKYICIGFLVLTAYLLPFYVLWDNSPVPSHDNLDSTIIFRKMLAESGTLLSSPDVLLPQMMNGLPRHNFPSEFNLYIIFFNFLNPFSSYLLNLTIIHFVAFIGMVLLLKNHFLRDKNYQLIYYGVALAFSLLPFYTNRGLGIAGMPLLLYAFLNIRSKKWSILDIIIIILFPFYSPFTHVGFFIICALIVLCVFDLFSQKDWNYLFYFTIFIYSFLSCLVDYRIFLTFFLDPSFHSSRTDILLRPSPGSNITVFFQTAMESYINGQYHNSSLHSFVILPSIALSIFILLCKKYENLLPAFMRIPLKKAFVPSNNKNSKIFALLLLCSVLISLNYAIFVHKEFIPIITTLGVFATFNFSRFISLFPLIWYILFALALQIIVSTLKIGKVLVIILLVVQIGFLFTYPVTNTLQGGGLGVFRTEQMSFNEFYSPDLFNEIRDTIGIPQKEYKVVNLGMHPAIAIYNGFYTIDGYVSNYPIEYKYKFREIIKPELEKDKTIREYFDYWGGRCTLYSSELGSNFMFQKTYPSSIKNLTLNHTALLDMGCNYVFSGVKIENAGKNNLTFIKKFENSHSPWAVWLYSVNN